LRLYGKGAKANDVYLYNAAKMGKLGEAIVAAGYNPYDPTPEGIAAAKSKCKMDRYIAKRFTLASNYGAGPGKIHQALTLDGVDISFEECQQYHEDFWKLYAEIKEFGNKLKMAYYRNDGWIYNGFCRPLAIDGTRTKDIINRFIQSTGHDILMRFLFLFRMQHKNFQWAPWLIDFHDEMMIEVPEESAEEAAAVLTQTLAELNKELKWDIEMTGTPEIGTTLADFKCED
jgi:DNA polymerase I-like protein with 3'-5' exonuclease and polymerase domains